MGKQKIKNLLLVGLLALFNFSFWRESWGVNLVVFGASLSSVVYYLNRDKVTFDLKVLFIVLGTILSGGTVLMFNSDISILSFIISTLILIGVFIQGKFQSIYYLGIASIINLFKNFPKFSFKGKKGESNRKKYNWLKIGFIPLGLTVVFYYLYRWANPAFEEWTIIFWDNFAKYWGMIFEDYPLTRFLFIALGGLIIGSLVWAKPIRSFLKSDEKELNDLKRNSKVKTFSKIGKIKPKAVIRGLYQGLVNEYRIALLSFASLNFLLLIFNISDIVNVWFGKAYELNAGLHSEMLHTGTNILIFTILLSVGIVLFHFRGNLNFLRKRKMLKQLAALWLFQNVILVAGVMMRAIRYIDSFGLTYKRIGVMVFTLLVIGGLVSVIRKVVKRKSNYFLYRFNFAYSYAVIILLSLFNWDVYIAKYNLSRVDSLEIDTSFLLGLNDRALFVLAENKDAFEGKSYDNSWLSSSRGWSQSQVLEAKINTYMRKQSNRTIWSWNYGDAKCYEQLKKLE